MQAEKSTSKEQTIHMAVDGLRDGGYCALRARSAAKKRTEPELPESAEKAGAAL